MSPTIISKYMQKQLAKLFNFCHSKMENGVPRNASVRYLLDVPLISFPCFYFVFRS